MRRAFLILFCVAADVEAQGVTWGKMSPVREIPDTIALRYPAVVVSGDTTIVAANHFPNDLDRVAGRRRLVIARSPGGMLPIPNGSFDFAFPHLARDARGTLHLVWAEFADSSGSLTAWMTPPTSLWHSVLRNGRWSMPRKIFAGRRLSWTGDGRSMVSDAAGNIHIAAPALPATGQFAVVHLRVDSAGTVTEQDLAPGAAYASITHLSGDSLLIAFSTSDSETPKGGSSILVRTSADGGRSWTSPSVIDRSDHHTGSAPLVERTSNGLEAFWVEPSRSSKGGSAVRRFSARSSAGKWTAIEPEYAIEGAAVRVVSSGAVCGSYAAILETLNGSPNDPAIRLIGLAVYNGRLAATPLFPDLEGAMAVGIGADRDGFRLIFAAIRHGEQRAIPATATGRACRTM